MSCSEIFTREEILAMIRDARSALHRLMLGEQEVEVRDQNNEMIKYSRTSKKDLEEYIQYLESLIGCRKVLKPIEFFF